MYSILNDFGFTTIATYDNNGFNDAKKTSNGTLMVTYNSIKIETVNLIVGKGIVLLSGYSFANNETVVDVLKRIDLAHSFMLKE